MPAEIAKKCPEWDGKGNYRQALTTHRLLLAECSKLNDNKVTWYDEYRAELSKVALTARPKRKPTTVNEK